MSQVFRGDRHITLEQALGISQFIGMAENERDFFLLLVQKDKAGNFELESVYQSQIDKAKKQSKNLKDRIKHQKFDKEAQATFYSSWQYSAIRLASSLENINSVQQLSEQLGIEREKVAQILDFLISQKLVVKKKNVFDMGPQVTHVGKDSAFVANHHRNWRLKAIQSMGSKNSNDLFYTGPMSLSKSAVKEIQSRLLKLIDENTKLVKKSESQTLHCLNIDWFKF